jgi:glycosyltransferase involved in cell wall biosynthesis
LKVLRVIASLDPVHGGPSQGVRHSIGELERLGIRNEVVSCDAPDAAWLGQDSFRLHALGPGKFGYAHAPRLYPWLLENLGRFDAVVVHGLWLWPSIAALRALKKSIGSKPRFFLMPHGMLDPWFQRDPSRRLKAVRNFFYWWLVERHVVNGADALLLTCEEELRLARQTFGGYHPRREINVGYGIPEPPPFTESMRTAFLERVPGLGGRPYVLFLGRIHPKKGVDLLVNAYLQILKTDFPDLVIAGPGWDSEFGRRVAAAVGEHPKIHRVGMLEGEAKWGALYGCDAFVLPSHQENFGIAVVEALACNKPVLISNKVNIWREIAEDGAGVVEEDLVEGTARMLQRFVEGEMAGGDKGRFRGCFRRRFEIQQAAQSFIVALEPL